MSAKRQWAKLSDASTLLNILFALVFGYVFLGLGFLGTFQVTVAVASVYACSVLWPAWWWWPAVAVICRAVCVAHPGVTENEDCWKYSPAMSFLYVCMCVQFIQALYWILSFLNIFTLPALTLQFWNWNLMGKKYPKGRCFSAWKIFEARIYPAFIFLQFSWLTLLMDLSLPTVHFPAGTCARFWYLNNWIIHSRSFWTGFLIILMWFIIFGLLTLIGVKFNYKKLNLII